MLSLFKDTLFFFFILHFSFVIAAYIMCNLLSIKFEKGEIIMLFRVH